jgi:hypothetical protein
MSRWTRRSFLGASGALAAGALFPWLHARADAPPPRRLVLFYTPHGTVWDRWRPRQGAGGPSDFAMSPILAALERHRSRVVILDGLYMRDPYPHRVPHTFDLPALWTGAPVDVSATDFSRPDHGVTFGWNLGRSIDQEIATRLPQGTPFPTLELGVLNSGAHPATRMIYTGAAAPRHPLQTPSQAFDHVFAAGLSGAALARRRAVLDAVRGDLASVRPGLAPSDRLRLDAHETAIDELRQHIEHDGSCGPGARPVDQPLEHRIDQQLDLLAAALACGKTNIASFQLAIGDNDGANYPWAGIDSGGHHYVSHETSRPSQDKLAALYTWYTDRFAHLLDRLAATPESDGGTLLDHTLVIWGTEVGVGWDHRIDNVPFVVAGGAGGALAGGRYLRLAPTLHNRLLVDAARAMGLSDLRSFGSLDTGEGGVPGLFG